MFGSVNKCFLVNFPVDGFQTLFSSLILDKKNMFLLYELFFTKLLLEELDTLLSLGRVKNVKEMDLCLQIQVLNCTLS